MPTIGAGKHGYQEDIVLNIIEEEVKQISNKNADSISLKSISVVIFKEKQPTYRRSIAISNPSRLFQQTSPARLSTKYPLSNSSKASPGTISAMPVDSIGGMFGSVNIVLNEGDITKQKADAIINALPNSLKLSDGGGVCGSILKTGGQIVQDELDTFRTKGTLGPIFVTSAGSIANVKKIIHFVPATTDAAGLQNSVEKCISVAQQNSLGHLLIPAIGTANFNIMPDNSANLILNAARKFSKAENVLTLEIVIFLKKIFPHFQKAVGNQGKELRKDSPPPHGSSKADDSYVSGKSVSVAKLKSENQSGVTSIGTVEKVKISFIGFKENIEDAISDTNALVNSNKVEKSVEDVGNIIQQHKSEIEKLSEIYRVLIKYSTPRRFDLEGMKADVAEFLVKFAELQIKYIGNSGGV